MMNGSFRRAAIALLTAASLMVSPVHVQSQEAPAQSTPAPLAAPASGLTRNLKLSAGPDYSKGPRWFPDITAPYRQIKMPEPPLANSPHVGQLIQGGQLMLSLEDAISLGLEDNLDIAVKRFTPWLDQAALLLAKSGANGRIQFDPTGTASVNLSQQDQPINNPFLAGVGGSVTSPIGMVNHNVVGNFGYTQGFATGTQAQVTFNNSRTSTNFGGFDLFNPYQQTSLSVQVTQPLLNGFGKLPNTRYILEAKNTVKVGESQFAQQVIATVTQVATDYWELVYARESVKVQEAAVAVSKKLYEDNKKQLEIGTMAPLDVLTAESQLSTDQQNLIVAETTRLQDQTKVLNDITKDPLAGPLATIDIIPTTPIAMPEVTEAISIQDAMKEAWQKRPEIEQAELTLKNAGIEVKATRNGLLPTLNVFGLYQAAGLGGVHNVLTPIGAYTATTPVFAASGSIPPLTVPIGYVGTPVTTTTTVIPGGLSNAWDAMIHGTYPTLEAGLTLTLPFRNRAAQAASATAQINQRQQEVLYRQLQNTIFLSVRNAQIALAQGRGQVAAAEKARSLAQQTLDDEQKKYQLGASTSYNVVLRERDLTAAQGTELRARISLLEAELNFNQAMGRTLDVNRIVVAGARPAGPAHVPNIPGAPDASAEAGN
jgi:outer membrane protein